MKKLLTALSILTIGTTVGTTINGSSLSSKLSVINDIGTEKTLLIKNQVKYHGSDYVEFSHSEEHGHECNIFNINISDITLVVWAVIPQEKIHDKIAADIATFQITGTEIVPDYIIDLLTAHVKELINTIPGSLTSYGITTSFLNNEIRHWGPQYSPISNNANIIEKNYRFLAHDKLKVGISRYDWERIMAVGKNEKAIFKIISDFPQWDASGWLGYISNDDLHTLSTTIVNHFDEAAEKFKKSDTGWKLVTNTEGDWEGFQAE